MNAICETPSPLLATTGFLLRRKELAGSGMAGQREGSGEPPKLAIVGATVRKPRCIPMRIEAIVSACDSRSWDAFAECCEASFRCGYSATRVWQFERHMFFKMVRLDIVMDGPGGPMKIGQCAVGVSRRFNIVSDVVQLLPDHQDLWSQAMRAVLERVGPGRYIYGSEWTLDPCRAQAVARLPGVDVTCVYSLDVQAVDFKRWPDWASYYRAVSTNAKRNIQKTEKAHLDLDLHERSRFAVFGDLVPLQRSRHRLFKRKSIDSSLPSLIIRSAFRLVATRAYSNSVRLRDSGATLARYLGIDFGAHTFFLEAASDTATGGASSYLLKQMIQRAHERSSGRGKFVMGPDDHRQRGTASWDGLVRSREQWKVTPHATSVMTFDYFPSAG